MKQFLTFFIIFFICTTSFANDSKMYILPSQAKTALNAIVKELSHAKKEVKITIYNFTHKKIANRLKYIAKKGVKVKIIFDFESSEESKSKSMLYYLAKYKNIDVYQIKGKYSKSKKYYGKMHQKVALIDNKTLILGSVNWSYSGFGKNYEILLIEHNKKLAKQYSDFFDQLVKKAVKY